MNWKLACLIGVSLAWSLGAQEWPEKRPLVTVTGSAEVKAAPDIVEISLGVEVRNSDLNVAIAQQQARVSEALSLIKKAGVEAKDIQTDFLSINPVYNEFKGGRTLNYYGVRGGIMFTLRDLSKFDSLMPLLVQSGINHVYAVNFRVSDMRKLRDEARGLAVAAAQEKAVALAGRLGQKIGKAFSIDEEDMERQPVGRSALMAPLMVNSIVSEDGGAPDDGGALMPGQIPVRARVTVKFELQ